MVLKFARLQDNVESSFSKRSHSSLAILLQGKFFLVVFVSHPCIHLMVFGCMGAYLDDDAASKSCVGSRERWRLSSHEKCFCFGGPGNIWIRVLGATCQSCRIGKVKRNRVWAALRLFLSIFFAYLLKKRERWVKIVKILSTEKPRSWHFTLLFLSLFYFLGDRGIMGNWPWHMRATFSLS